MSGAHINPAVTLGLAAAGSFPWSQVPIYWLAQMIGAAIGAALVYVVYHQHFAITNDAEKKLAVFCTAPAIRDYRHNFVSEVVATASCSLSASSPWRRRKSDSVLSMHCPSDCWCS